MASQTTVSIVFRYWRKGKLLQLQADVASVAIAIKTVLDILPRLKPGDSRLMFIGVLLFAGVKAVIIDGLSN